MNYFYSVVELLGGLGAFLLGFNYLSSSLENIASSKLKKVFEKISKNRLMGVGVGVGVTCIVQSSSVVTVMIVGFVNSGILNLTQATAMIMGANIGTTITAQIVALESFDISKIAVSLTAIGFFITMIFKKKKNLGNCLAGIGLVFVGLMVMSLSMNTFKESEAITNVLTSISNPFLLLFVGLAVTAIVQSSSAVTTIIISMVGAGMMIGKNPNDILFVILGTNIGTCVTALISSIGTNTNAKRAAIIHLMFNVFGSVVFTIILLIWKNFMVDTLEKAFPFKTTQIAMFHTLFNLVCTIIFLPFVNGFVKLSKILIRDPKKEEDFKSLDERLLLTQTTALIPLYQEFKKLSELSFKALEDAMDAFCKKDLDKLTIVNKEISDAKKMHKDIVEYMVKVTTNNDEKTTNIINDLYKSLMDINRILEIADNVGKYLNETISNDLVFKDEIIISLEEMFNNVKELFNESMDKFMNHSKNIEKLDFYEDLVDANKKKLIDDHIKRLNEGACSPSNSGIFINLVSNLERVADHIYQFGYRNI